MVRRKIKNIEEAQLCIEAAAACGKSRAEWARDHGIDPRSLHAWWLNLERRSARTPVEHPLRMVELVPQLRRPPTSGSYHIRIEGIEVVVDDQFREETLRRILTVLLPC
jgi:transposase-like protein